VAQTSSRHGWAGTLACSEEVPDAVNNFSNFTYQLLPLLPFPLNESTVNFELQSYSLAGIIKKCPYN
jgi:hypothetical protein